MDITWLGHSCFRIKGKEVVIITDPFSPEIGYPFAKTKANIVTVSHSHPGHSSVEMIEGEFKVLNGPGEYELGGVFITGFPSFHDNSSGNELGKNTIYFMEVDGVTLCHLGDLGHTLSSEIEGELTEVGVLFLPVGGVSTIDGNAASEMVRRLAPKVVIPMHYQTPAITRNLDPLDTFLRKMGLKEIASQPKFSVTRANIPLTTQVVVLNYQR